MAIIVTICGEGNAAHVMMGQMGSVPGVETRVLALQSAPQLQAALAETNNLVTVTNKFDGTRTVGKVDMVSSNPADVIPNSDLTIIPLPVFAHRPYLEAIAPHIDVGSAVGVLPGQGGTQWLAKKIFGDKFSDITFFAGDKLPYNARIDEFGKSVNLVGLKPKVGIATIPAGDAQRVADLCTKAFTGFWSGVPLASILDVSLMPVNQCLHPSRMYDLFSQWDGKTIWEENPLFYDDMTDSATSIMHKVDDEIQAVAEALRSKYGMDIDVPKVHPMLVSWYDESMIGDPTTLTSYFRTNKGYSGIGTPMAKVEGGWVPDFTTRYFTEDVPYGLCVTRGVATMAEVPTPTIDMLIEWAQKNMGKEYLDNNGKFVGKDIKDTFSPQAFGFHTPKDLC